MILGLHHVQITAPTSMEVAAIRFYGEVLGLPIIDKPRSLEHRGGAWFQLGMQELHLAIEDGVNRLATKAHLAYDVSDLEFWRKRMLENEVVPIDSVPIPGYDRFEVRDPFGNRIEFIERLGQTNPPMITDYHHTQVTAPKGAEAEVRRFYGQVLGLTEMPVPDSLRGRNLIWFHIGDRSLHVGFEDGINRAATNAHLAYEVNDIAEYRRRLKDAGFELIEQIKLPGYDRFHTRDPFGNRLEIIGRDGG